MKRKVLSLIMALSMILGTLTTGVFAADVADLTISTVAELQAFAESVNNGNTYEGKTVVLASNIDMEFSGTPIGTSSNSFKGTFDGQGHTIDNLYITYFDGEKFTGSCVGLFGVINSPAVIKNVTVNNPYLVAEQYVGGIVGKGYTGTIENCHVTGEIDIEGNYMVGGINGHGYADVNNCSVIGDPDWDYNCIWGIYKAEDIEGDSVGGIVGHFAEGSKTMSNCHVANVEILGTRKVGGLVGTGFENHTYKNCSVENATVGTNATAEYAASKPDSMGIGGLVGLYCGYSGGAIEDCEVSDIEFTNENNVTVSAGALAGGTRNKTEKRIDPPTVETTGTTVVTVTGATNEYFKDTTELPEAKLEKLDSMVLTTDDSYMTWPSGDSSIDRPLNVVVKFSAIDTEETVETSPYKGWYTDYYITFDGLKDGSFVADGCYLAGNYGSFGWIVIPTDGLEVEDGAVYPVVSSYDAHLTYEEICTNVKEMICAIYIKPEIIDANPDMTVTLNLGIKNGDEGEVVYVNSSVYEADELAGYVAQVGDEKYTSLADAFIAANGNTVTLLGDVALTEKITVPAGKTVTLDLNGKTITGTDPVASGNFALITNKGIMTIDDSVGTGSITLSAENNRGWSALSAVISNEGGTLTVKNGKIEHLGGTDMAYGIDNNSTLGETKVVVKGGTIISPYRGIRAFQNNKTKMNSVVMEGGKIVAKAGIWMHQSGADSLGEVTVTGGKIEAASNAIVTDIHSGAKTTITIKGGEFSNTSTTANLLLVWPFDDMSKVTEANETVVNIEGGSFDCAGEGNLIGVLNGADANTAVVVLGGTFSEEIAEEYIAEGFKLITNNNGTYGVKPDVEVSWTTDTDAGFYRENDAVKGMMRFLFHVGLDKEIEKSGIQYIDSTNITANVQVGEQETGTRNAFHGDIINIPEDRTGSYYAVGFVVVDGKWYWSEPVECKPNFTKEFTEYVGGVE